MKDFDLKKPIEILERTPVVLKHILQDISVEWSHANEGSETWSAFDVIGHLIHGEKTDWIPRIEIILSESPDKNFIPFDRFAQSTENQNKTLSQLLDQFEKIRKINLEKLKSKNITQDDLNKKGIHPAFGEVSLRQLIATWAVHDLNHISQITRVMAFQYKKQVGPWIEYLRILK